MAKDGKARVLSDEQFQYMLTKISENRHPEKNTLIMQLSFKLALRVQEISLLRIKEVAELNSKYSSGYKIHGLMVLPKRFTKGARARKTLSVRRSVRFSLDDFDAVVKNITKKTKAGKAVKPVDYYPEIKKSGGKTRELPLVDTTLRHAIRDYLDLRLTQNPKLKPTDPLVVSQKGGPYSANTLQEHMALMLRQWSGIERSTSHSGRRTLATKLIHEQGEHIKTVQQVLGHKDAATTVIYHELPEGEIKRVLKKAGKSFND